MFLSLQKTPVNCDIVSESAPTNHPKITKRNVGKLAHDFSWWWNSPTAVCFWIRCPGKCPEALCVIPAKKGEPEYGHEVLLQGSSLRNLSQNERPLPLKLSGTWVNRTDRQLNPDWRGRKDRLARSNWRVPLWYIPGQRGSQLCQDSSYHESSPGWSWNFSPALKLF